MFDAETSFCENIIIVKSGRLRSYSEIESKRTINLYYLNEGEICVIAASRHLFNYSINIKIVADQASTVIKIPVSIYMELEHRYPEVALYSRRLFADRFSDILFAVEEKAFKKDEDVLKNFLIEEAAQNDGYIYKSQEEIEKEIAVSRSQISSLLSRLEKRGAIETSRRVIKVTDLKLLF